MEDLKTWIVKIILPSLVAVSIKLAVEAKNASLSWLGAISSYLTGVGFAYLCADYVLNSVGHQFVPIVIALIAISGEKIGNYLVYKFNVEAVLGGLLDRFRTKK